MSEREQARFTQRQFVFVVEYLRDRDATAAALRAGYADSTARRAETAILALDHVREAVDLLLCAVDGEVARACAGHAAEHGADAECPVSRETIIQGLLDEARNMDKGATHSARVAAWTNIARIQGLLDKEAKTQGGKVKKVVVSWKK